MGFYAREGREWFLMLALMLATGGCTGLLGDFGAGPAGDSGTIDVGIAGSSGGDASVPQGDAGDASLLPTEGAAPGDSALGNDSPADATPTPPPGKPGFDITAGGNTSTSTNYILIAAVGESPGGNIIIGTSPSYTLKGGVIAGTQ